MQTLIQDLRFGLRMLTKNPGFSLVVVLTLALGIGACTTIFSLVNRILLQALPYDQPNQLVQLWEDPSGKGQDRNSVAGCQFAAWREQITTMEKISVVRRVNLNLTGQGRPERLNVHQVSASYLGILRLRPFLGRDFLADEDQPGRDKVVVLTHKLWQGHFGAATNLVGRSIRLGGESYTVIGILPAKPQLPFDCDVLVPFVYGSEPWHQRQDHRLRVLGRLKASVTLEQARAEMSAITQRLKPEYPSWKKDWGVTIVPMHEQLTGAIRPQLWVLFGAVGFVLLIACANVASLLLARMEFRKREMAIRAALGAGRRRVIRQLLTESVLLSLLGGMLGLLLAVWGERLFIQLSAGSLPRAQELGLDFYALGFALFLSVGTGIMFGLAPALHLANPSLNDALKQTGRGSSTRSGNGLRGGLIVAEVALALTLLVGAGLLLTTLSRLQAVPAGFNPHGVLAMDISLDDRQYPDGECRAIFLKQVIQRIESLPGVEAAGSATTLPMSGSTDNSVRAESQPDQDEFYINTDYDFVSGNYFRAMGISLLRGRAFAEPDNTTNAPRSVIMNAALASRVFPGQDPLNQRVRFLGQSWEIIGLVGDVRHRGLDRDRTERLYLPQAFSFLPCSLVARMKVPPLALAETIRGEILKLDPNQPISNVRTLEQVVANSVGQRRLMFVLLGLFAGAALLLAAIGLYGVMAYSVSQRTREIGIRMALGAQRVEVLKMVLRRGMTLALLGATLGLLGAFALTGVLTHLLFGVAPRDPFTLAVVTLLQLGIALFACWLPARRATRIDPMVALRSE